MVAVESCACLRLLSSATTDGTILCVSFCLLRSVLSVMSAATVVLSLSLSLSLHGTSFATGTTATHHRRQSA